MRRNLTGKDLELENVEMQIEEEKVGVYARFDPMVQQANADKKFVVVRPGDVDFYFTDQDSTTDEGFDFYLETQTVKG